MIFYRYIILWFIEYFGLNKPSPREELLMKLLKKKKKVEHKTQLKVDQTYNFYVTMLLSVICPLICLSVPLAILDSPCDILLEYELHQCYAIAKFLKEYINVVDFFILALIITLIRISTKMILDGIKYTKINISPWLEMGKYTLPSKTIQIIVHEDSECEIMQSF
ncbi:uncharacterized protein LOC116413815 [Galleria mellonella]|uniref:Uncharacterized protein LOC116413815 n=1 Tax=Galleria mellonella TaxID=7137 RepID=A0A6J3CE10_GALME|nr:uncharacterized protein LOC116413815 [Galleria mellonella]